jgi:hypothetical protein
MRCTGIEPVDLGIKGDFCLELMGWGTNDKQPQACEMLRVDLAHPQDVDLDGYTKHTANYLRDAVDAALAESYIARAFSECIPPLPYRNFKLLDLTVTTNKQDR